MQEKLFYSGRTHYSEFPLCSGCCEMHWICLTTEHKSCCQDGRMDRATTKRKHDAWNDLFPLLVDDNVTLRGEHVFMCQSETDGAWETEREPSITRSISAVRCNQGEIGLARSVAPHRQIFLQQSVCVSVFVTQTRWDWRKRTKRKYEVYMGIGVPWQQFTYQRIKHLEPISLRAFIQNTKESVQSVL